MLIPSLSQCKTNNMRTPGRTLVLVMAVLFLGSFSVSYGQMTIQGGNISMTISTGAAGGEPTPVTDATIALRFKLQTSLTKITVRTTCPGQRFNLAVVASSVPVGTPAPEVSLIDGMFDVDLIVSIPPKPPNANQTATLLYTASSTFAQGNSAELGNDVHTVTYTLTDQ